VKSERKFCKTPRQPPFADAFLTARLNQPVSTLGLGPDSIMATKEKLETK
jgi:hypothetical protein